MQRISTERTRWWIRAAASVALVAASFVWGAAADPGTAESLRASQASLREKLSQNAFQRPLVLDSTESSRLVKGDIHAELGYAFSTVRSALTSAAHWCDVMILHLNTKYCRASTGTQGTSLAVQLGRKVDEPLDAGKQVEFAYHVAADTPSYFRILLDADAGPFGTRNYRIAVEAIPTEEGKSFLHLSYSYEFGISAKLALQAYLNTLGSGKIGFTVVDKRPDGQPVYVGDVRGALERNVMRYYLAIEAYLSAMASPPQEQAEKRFREWFAGTERYAAQLHELEQNDYLEMKRREVRRQQAEAPAAK